jgi:uncharacterized protein DUF3604
MRAAQLYRAALVVLLTLGLALPLGAQEQDPVPPTASLEHAFPAQPYSPYAARAFPTRVFWDDTHLHTAYSMDAGAFGAQGPSAPKYSAKVPPSIQTPDTVQTRLGTLKSFDGLPDEATVK